MRRRSMNRIGKFLALAVAITVLVAACGDDKESDPLKLVPEGSNLIAEVNLVGILASDGPAGIIESLPRGEGESAFDLDGLLDFFVAETGVDIRQFTRAVLFGDVTQDEDHFGVIALGEFDEVSLISGIRSATEDRMVSTEYKGRLLYSSEDDGDSFSFTVLDEGILVLGTEEAVKAVVDVREGDLGGVSGPILDAFGNLGSALVKLEFDVTATDLRDQDFDLGEIPFLGGAAEGLAGSLEAVQDLELAGLAFSQNGQILILRVNLDFANEDAAASINNILDGLLKLGAGLSPVPELADALERVQLSLDGAKFSIRIEISAPEISELVGSVTGISSSESGFSEAPLPVPAIREFVAMGEEVPIMPTRNHIGPGQSVQYNSTPPTSGDHSEQWADCGFYDEGLPDELITHNLEHGNIVVSYNLAGQQEVDVLKSVWPDLQAAEQWGIARFYDKIPVGTIAVAAWGRLDTITEVDVIRNSLNRIDQFLASYAGNLGPERIPC